MKKTIALVLALCLLAAALPVIAESPRETRMIGSGLGGKLSDMLGGLKDKIKESKAGSALYKLIDGLKDKGGEAAAKLVSKLKELLSKVLKDPTGKIAALLLKAKEKLDSGNGSELEALLGGDTGETAPEDDEDIAETLERLNREAEADTGDSVPDKKPVESVEEFYGHWTETKIDFDGTEIDMSDEGEGAYFAENTYYITQNGEKSPDYLHPETAELTIRDGVLKVNSDGNWTTYVMTNSGDIVMTGSSFLVYFSRVDQ